MRILVADQLAQAGVDALAADHDVDVRTGLPKDELLQVVPGYHAIVVRSATTLDADVIAAATDLQVIGRAGVGLDNVDIDAATRQGVVVCNAPQSNVVSAAEHTMALLLSLARNVPQAHAALIEGRWERKRWNGMELQDKVLGVLGLGRIGTLVAQRAHAFGMRLTAYDPFVSPERAARLGVRLLDTVEEVVAEADVITIHLPKNADTVGLLDTAMLARMKPTARVLNVARGGIVVEADLAQALKDGVIAGAALDVFDVEPTTESPLFGLPNAIVTPHLGASTEEAQDRAGVQVAEAVSQALSGELVPSAVNVQGGPVPDPVKPYLAIAEKLGRLLATLTEAEGLAGEVTVEACGTLADEDTRIVALSTLRGLLSASSSEPVTFVNAPLFAQERGLSLREVSDPNAAEHLALLRVSGVTREGRTVQVAGTVVEPGGRERLVEVWDTPVDVEPTDHMAFFRYEDRPGVIGAVGTGFGEAGVNIAAAQVGRHAQGGEAIMALSLDQAPSREVVDGIGQRIGAVEGRSVAFG